MPEQLDNFDYKPTDFHTNCYYARLPIWDGKWYKLTRGTDFFCKTPYTMIVSLHREAKRQNKRLVYNILSNDEVVMRVADQ